MPAPSPGVDPGRAAGPCLGWPSPRRQARDRDRFGPRLGRWPRCGPTAGELALQERVVAGTVLAATVQGCLVVVGAVAIGVKPATWPGPIGPARRDREPGRACGRRGQVYDVTAWLGYPAKEPGASDARVARCRGQPLAASGQVLADVPGPPRGMRCSRAQRPKPRCDRPHRGRSDDQTGDEGSCPEDEPRTPVRQARLQRYPFSGA